MITIILKSGDKYYFNNNISISESNGRYVVDNGTAVETFPVDSVDRIIKENQLTP